MADYAGRALPTAIWAQNDIIAAAVLKSLTNQGYRVPEDISLLGMDDIQLCTMVTPMLSTIHQPLREIAQESIRIIMENEPGAKPQPRRVFLTPTLQVRESTAPPNPVAD